MSQLENIHTIFIPIADHKKPCAGRGFSTLLCHMWEKKSKLDCELNLIMDMVGCELPWTIIRITFDHRSANVEHCSTLSRGLRMSRLRRNQQSGTARLWPRASSSLQSGRKFYVSATTCLCVLDRVRTCAWKSRVCSAPVDRTPSDRMRFFKTRRPCTCYLTWVWRLLVHAGVSRLLTN